MCFSNGWEKNGLFEFFKAKLKYIKDKPRNIAAVVRSPSPPPVAAQPPATGQLPPLMRDSPQRSPQRRCGFRLCFLVIFRWWNFHYIETCNI